MNDSLHSEGKCLSCGGLFARSGISRHLAGHLKKLEAEKPGKGKAYHVRAGAGDMFLNLLVSGSQSLQLLDDFLRDIWLECCGHMSSFQIKGKRYHYGVWDFDNAEFGEPMGKRMDKIFTKGMMLKYEYDFGSTTELDVKIFDGYRLDAPDGVLLLSRNEPLHFLCERCGKKPATQLCTVHWNEANMFCDDCAEKHAEECEDFEDYAIPVVNSPRMGVCGYTGGSIDLERDGPWKG